MTDWAIDAHIVMQQAVRRLLGACVEYTNGRIFVPERALALARTHYRSIARRHRAHAGSRTAPGARRTRGHRGHYRDIDAKPWTARLT